MSRVDADTRAMHSYRLAVAAIRICYRLAVPFGVAAIPDPRASYNASSFSEEKRQKIYNL